MSLHVIAKCAILPTYYNAIYERNHLLFVAWL